MRIAWIDPLGRIPQQEVTPFESRTFTENGQQELLSRAWVGSRFKDDAGSGGKDLADLKRRIANEAKIRKPISQWRRNTDDNDVRNRGIPQARHRLVSEFAGTAEVLIGHIFNEAHAGSKRSQT